MLKKQLLALFLVMPTITINADVSIGQVMEATSALLIAPVELISHTEMSSESVKQLKLIHSTIRIAHNALHASNCGMDRYTSAWLIYDIFALGKTLQETADTCCTAHKKRIPFFWLFPLIESVTGIMGTLESDDPNQVTLPTETIRCLGSLSRITESLLKTNLDFDSSGQGKMYLKSALLTLNLFFLLQQLQSWKNHSIRQDLTLTRKNQDLADQANEITNLRQQIANLQHQQQPNPLGALGALGGSINGIASLAANAQAIPTTAPELLARVADGIQIDQNQIQNLAQQNPALNNLIQQFSAQPELQNLSQLGNSPNQLENLTLRTLALPELRAAIQEIASEQKLRTLKA